MGSALGDFAGAGSAKDGYTVDKRDVSDDRRPIHGNPQIDNTPSTVSTSSHSPISCLTFSDSGKRICCARLLSSHHTVSTNAVAPQPLG